MRFTLPRFILVPAVLAATLLVTNTAMAAVKIQVPFSFTVNGQNCPAGFYTVDRDGFRGIVTLKSNDSTQSFNWALGPGDGNLRPTKVVLKFDEVGETHTLRSVQYGDLITPRLDKHLKESKQVSLPSGQGR